MYNETYIQEFDEKTYLDTLSDVNKLSRLRDIALSQYNENADAYSLAYKESLDHYVLKRLKTDPKFIESQEFKNYLTYSLTIAHRKTLRATDKYTVYPELLTNPVFRDNEMRATIFNRYVPVEKRLSIERARNNSKKIVDYVFSEMAQGHRLTPDLINIAADYIYSSRDVEDGKGEIFAKYVLNNAEALKLKSSVAIAGAFTTIFGKSYDLDIKVKDSRFFIANNDGGYKTRTAHSSGIHKYCVFSQDAVKDLSLTSCDSLFKSRTMKTKDIYWLMFVSFHELTHQHQGYDHDRGLLTTSGISRAINRVLNHHMPRRQRSTDGKVVCDYDVNHDSDETEMEADEEGWRQTRKFIHKMLDRKNRMFIDAEGKEQDKWVLAWDNESVIRTRRAFTVKKDVETFYQERNTEESKKSKGVYYAYYDLVNLERIMKEHPEERDNSPILRRLFNRDGSMRVIDILTMDLYRNSQQDSISLNSSNNAGLEIGTYVLNYKWDEVRSAIDRGEIQTRKQADMIRRNMYHIIHEHVLKSRDFKKIAREGQQKRKYDGIDVSQYDETQARFDLNDPEMSKQLHEYYFRSVCVGVRRFYEYKAIMKAKYGVDIKDDGLYLDSYVYEMYNELEDKDEKSCMAVLETFKESKDPHLVHIYDTIMENKRENARRREAAMRGQDQGQMDNSGGKSR